MEACSVFSVLQCSAVCCSVLQCVVVYCSFNNFSRLNVRRQHGSVQGRKTVRDAPRIVLQCVAVRCSVLQRIAARYSVLRCVAARCSELRCVAKYCSVLQHHLKTVRDVRWIV